MARALWSGAIAFGLVNIPVKLYGATESKDLSFTTLHASCMTALKRPYEFAKGQYVILRDEDFDKIPLEATKALEVQGFIEAQEISPLYRERNYYLGPEEISLKPFELFRQALMRTGKVAIARAVLWKKEQLVAISPLDGGLVLTTLMYQDEVKPPPEPPATHPIVISDAEIELALQLIGALTTEFDPSKFRDRYRDALMTLIQAKVEGKELPAVAKVETKPTQDLKNRRLNFIEDRYPDLKVHTRKDAILDGEIVVMKGPLPSFEKLQERERASGKINIEYLAKTLPATYIVFDILYVGEKEVMSLPQMERKALLPDIVEVDDRVVLSDYIERRGVDYYNAVIARGLEGIIAKHKRTRYYTGKRSKDWIKIKKKATLDCVICGITAGEGEREDTFGSLILGVYHEGKLVHVGRVGTGFSEAGRRSIIERLRPLQGPCPFPEVPEIDAHVGFWTRPVLVAEAHFLEWSKDRRMRAPSFSRMRDDKRPEECVVTFP